MKTKVMISNRAVSAILALAVALGAGSAMATLTNAKINGAAAGTGTAIADLKTPPTISVTSSGDAAVWVTFTHKGATWRLPMTNGGAEYSVVMPVMPAGTVSYRIESGTAFDPYSSTNVFEFLPATGTYSYINSETLTNLRQPALTVWKSVVGSNLDFSGLLDANWRGVALGIALDNTVILKGNTNFVAHNFDPQVKTRQTMTVGSIWFKAKLNGSGGPGTLYVEKSAGSYTYSEHEILDNGVIEVPYTSNWIQYRIDIDSDTPAYYRIRHPSGIDSDNIIIKDIVISAPAADVVISKEELEYSPGYPSRHDPVTFKVSVTNVLAGAPASNISPKLVWRLNEGAWTQTPMPPIGGNQYEVTLPKMDPGDFEYYYRADFTGYAYTGPFYVTSGNPADNESDFSIWLDSSDNIAETKGPAYYPDFTNSQLYNLGVEPPLAINDGSELEDPFSYLSFNIRRFRSAHDTMTLALVPTDGTNLFVDPAYNMEQVGDYTWQAVLHLTNAVDIGASVVGTYRYTSGATMFEPVPVTWLEDNQDPSAKNPPMSGFAVDESGIQPIQIQIDYDGFMMFRFCATNGYYEVRRAAWQDFNAWQASNTEFTRSFGLYETDTFQSDLVGKSPTVMDSAIITPFEVGTTVSPSILNSEYLNGLRVDKSWLIQERVKTPADPVPILNRAVKVSASPTSWGRGSIQTTSDSASDGRDTLTMRVRASMDDDNFAIYKRGVFFENYKVTAEAKTLSMSDGNPSVSVYGYYQDKNNYLEARLTQERNTTTNNDFLTLKLIQAKSGVVTTLKTVNYTAGNPKLNAANEWWLMLTISSSGPSGGTALFQIGNNSATAVATTTPAVGFTIDYPNVFIGGTIAVNSRDAQTEMQVSMTTDTGTLTTDFSNVATSTMSSWDLAGYMDVSGLPRWTLAQGSGSANPTMLKREIPNVKYKVSVYRNGLETGDFVAPIPSSGSDWNYAWDLFGTGDDEKSVNTFTYQNVSIPMHLWDNVFIQIAPTGSDGYLVVDDPAVKAWRGQTIYDPALSPNDPDEELVWKSTYAVISDYDRGDLGYELARSRANPAADQMIVSPLLVGGIGDILFNYVVTAGNVSFSVESLRQNGQVHQTLMTTNVYAGVSNTISRMYVAALTNITGRLRIRVNNSASSTNGVLVIDNLKATNYPNAGDTSWEAYNVLISTFDFNPGIKFDGAANTDFRSAVINNSYTANTPLNVAYDDDKPYLQSPKIDTGIGEVSFWYRKYPGTSGYAGKLYLKAAKNVSDPEDLWITLGIGDLNTNAPAYTQQAVDLNGLTNITTDVWSYFSVEFYKADYKIFRIYGDIDSSERVMLDNIIVTEPVRTSIDIASVELIPAVPLYTDQVGVRVDLTNPRMNPTDIRVYLLYVIGTNTWGRANWENSAVEVELTQDDNDPYLFAVTNAIPKNSIDTVVQYSVKVEYSGTFPSPVYYGDEFVNPDWYEPVDLNAQFASAGKSAYYFVFSVGTNCVFINEFLPYGYFAFWDTYAGLSEQYVELIGTDNGNVANWKLEHIKVSASSQTDVSMWTNVLTSTAKFTSRFVSGFAGPTDKGWGFYTLGCDGVSVTNTHFNSANPIIVDQVLFPASLYTPGYTGFANPAKPVGLGVPGGLCLKRSMGAYVDRVAWGELVDIGNLVQRGYKNAGTRGSGTSVYRKVFAWAQDASGESLGWLLKDEDQYSPGYFNTKQAELIWTIDAASDEEPSTPPEVAVSIKSIQLDATKATIQFAVSSTNGIALTTGNGFTWYIETSEDVSFTTLVEPVQAISGDITAPDTGAESLYSVEVNFGAPVSPALFYRLKAVHP